MKDTLIWLPDKAIGKARPRLSAKLVKGKIVRKIHSNARYKYWKNVAIAHFSKLLLEGLPKLPQPCEVECLFCNFASSDSDNLTGSILDALYQSKLIDGDSAKYVVASSGRFCKIKKRKGYLPIKGVLIKIRPAKIEYLSVELTNLIYSQLEQKS